MSFPCVSVGPRVRPVYLILSMVHLLVSRYLHRSLLAQSTDKTFWVIKEIGSDGPASQISVPGHLSPHRVHVPHQPHRSTRLQGCE